MLVLFSRNILCDYDQDTSSIPHLGCSCLKPFQRTEVYLCLLSSMLRMVVLKDHQVIWLERHKITCLFYLPLIYTEYSQTIILILSSMIWLWENSLNLFFFSLVVCILRIYLKRNITIKLLCFRFLRIAIQHVVKSPTAYLAGLICVILFIIFRIDFLI